MQSCTWVIPSREGGEGPRAPPVVHAFQDRRDRPRVGEIPRRAAPASG